MGIVYGVGCKQCRIWRDLDKMRGLWMANADTGDDAQRHIHELPENGICSAYLLATFMVKHIGHECVLFDDTLSVEEYELGFDTKDINYWQCSP